MAPESVVLDAAALVEALIGTRLGMAVRTRLRGCELHAPANLDAEVLSALGRLHRADQIDEETVSAGLIELAAAPVVRHPLASLLVGAWAVRDQLRLVDALYVELSTKLQATLLTTDARLSRATGGIELVTSSAPTCRKSRRSKRVSVQRPGRPQTPERDLAG